MDLAIETLKKIQSQNRQQNYSIEKLVAKMEKERDRKHGDKAKLLKELEKRHELTIAICDSYLKA